MRPKSRGWAAFSLVGIALWVGAMVLASVLSDDPTDPGPTLTAFVAGGAIFFGLMFGGALWQQVRTRPASSRHAWLRKVGIGYTLAGIAITALGLAAVWRAAEGEEVAVFIVPLIAIVVVWAVAALIILRKLGAEPP